MKLCMGSLQMAENKWVTGVFFTPFVRGVLTRAHFVYKTRRPFFTPRDAAVEGACGHILEVEVQGEKQNAVELTPR